MTFYSKDTSAPGPTRVRSDTIPRTRPADALRARGLFRAADLLDRVMRGRFLADDQSAANRAVASRLGLDESLFREYRKAGSRNNIHLGTVLALPAELALEILNACIESVMGELPSGVSCERSVRLLSVDIGRLNEAADEALLDGKIDENERIRLSMLLHKITVHAAVANRDLGSDGTNG